MGVTIKIKLLENTFNQFICMFSVLYNLHRNEKEGIPADLIGLLDVCVEIPQQGVIRSLNVHVSGAILVWEYRRQQMMAGKLSELK